MGEVIKGFDIALYVDTALEGALEPTWSLVGGQRGASLDRSKENVSINFKGVGGMDTDYFNTTSNWSIECDGIMFLDDLAYDFLEEAYDTNKKIMVELRRGNKQYAGEALITSLPIEGAHDSEASYTVSLQGCGKLVKEDVVA